MTRKKTKEKRKTKTITFQPTPETADTIELIKKKLGLGKSQIVRICVEQHLPFLLQKHIALTQSIVVGVPAIADHKAPNSMLGVVSSEDQERDEGEQRGEHGPSAGRKK